MFKVFTAILPLASLVSSLPSSIPHNNRLGFIPTQEQIDAVEAANNVTVKILAIQERLGGVGCAGQSCEIADLSGSTGRTPKLRPEGGGASDFKCIGKYNPAGVETAMKMPLVSKQPNGISGTLMGVGHAVGNLMPGAGPVEKGSFNGACTNNIVIFAKGTTEVGSLGITVGPLLNSGLPRGFSVVGVPYTADLAGDFCLGLPGGMVARDMLNQAAKKCPDSKIFLSGYSQGGMVSHIGVAYADEEAKKRVAGVVVFGDPFQGAPIKGYSGPIVTFCNDGDFVCTGNFVVGAAHLSYTGSAALAAIKEFKRIAAS